MAPQPQGRPAQPTAPEFGPTRPRPAHRRPRAGREPKPQDRAATAPRDTTGIRGKGYSHNIFILQRFYRQGGLSHHPYKGKPIDAKQIGKDLGVRYVLEGSARRVGETITINAQLISAETGAHVWADRFEGERSKLGELQVEAVSRLANSLGVELVKAEALRAARERPNNSDAVDLAMRGWAAYQSWGPASVNEALGYFERALRLDPGHTVSIGAETDPRIGVQEGPLGL